MFYIFVNLKRFDVPRALGGICPESDPVRWISGVMDDTIAAGLGGVSGIRLAYLLPEGLLPVARAALRSAQNQASPVPELGCQSVFREDVTGGGNFGAFTTNLPAAAATALGATWAIVGHSEERKDKIDLITDACPDAGDRVQSTVDRVVNQETHRALDRGISVLFCVGETADQRGEGTFNHQKPQIEAVLRAQVERGLAGVAERLKENNDGARSPEIVIGYEPIWAIGPGRTPPDGEYIGYVASFIKDTVQDLYGLTVPVVYGGGLKESNVTEIGSVESVDGGLVALTRFTEPVGFDVQDLARITRLFVAAKESA